MLTDFERLYSQNVFKVNLSLCRERAEAPDISWVNIQVVALRHNPAKLLLVIERTNVRIAAMTLERIGSFIAAYFSLQAIEGWRLFDSVTDCLVFICFSCLGLVSVLAFPASLLLCRFMCVSEEAA